MLDQSVVEEQPSVGQLDRLRAYWVRRDTIVWNIHALPNARYEVHYSLDGSLELTAKGIQHGQVLPLERHLPGLDADLVAAFPHLQGLPVFRLADEHHGLVAKILRGQVAVQAYHSDDQSLIDATALQIPGVLDDLYHYTGELGVSFDAQKQPILRLWAPTARNVELLLYADSAKTTEPQRHPMQFDEGSGVWSIVGKPAWKHQFYRYEIDVFVPSTGQFERNSVTDPYSLSLSTNSQHSQIVDLQSKALQPKGWSKLAKPNLAKPTDIVLYELHVRDFSITDPSVPAELRGTYKAFTQLESNGMQHLQRLAKAGLSHVHLLPVFDIATVEEHRPDRKRIDFEYLASLPADSPEQQAYLFPIRDRDGFNWGYDPRHYTTPEGSYSTDPDGATRILEFREMVQALNQLGLRVVMDVVYNHTHSSGQASCAVLDRVVPGYYHRLDADGNVCNSTCCANTASEHHMMEKLMLDSLRTWAVEYKIDGFRFDLMGHHLKRNMLAIREMLDGLTLAEHGVDGKAIYLYGEGWNFGEVADGARGENATQPALAGTGIGTFSDRLRDAARGGGPFVGFQVQGFATGLLDRPNHFEQRALVERNYQVAIISDVVRLSLAGNLADYPMLSCDGQQTLGGHLYVNGKPAAYGLRPDDHIAYVSAHDNETLFDGVQVKAPIEAPMAERVRMHNLALSLVALAQGIPFFHAGDELLRSKSMDRNSYNSSDWFNRIDWTGQQNTWGSGLPPSADNHEHWSTVAPLLADPALKPTPADMAFSYAHFQTMLQIRRSSELFRLSSAELIKQKLWFLNTGPEQVVGLVVMVLDDEVGEASDSPFCRIVVAFNGSHQPLSYSDASFGHYDLQLHPLLVNGYDPVLEQASFDRSHGSISVPGFSCVVWVEQR
ncbi:pullulanase-type alpha-1,6-glucosidase [Herpetosiphon giganteus]|uniref:pullulanase-type alpha-1,6-glucosidase n=1 Tax=Herpetosiphon giganteus TaxID=2029754 RepID=UPI00195E79B4|nr:pullulanase-type alpha-1,6-glucosidase [Herpetosiphon giganteus]MBM7841845.1 pullulanase-type alpha-1,6-glucosidase [Herpetosiphon giganteus]